MTNSAFNSFIAFVSFLFALSLAAILCVGMDVYGRIDRLNAQLDALNLQISEINVQLATIQFNATEGGGNGCEK